MDGAFSLEASSQQETAASFVCVSHWLIFEHLYIYVCKCIFTYVSLEQIEGFVSSAPFLSASTAAFSPRQHLKKSTSFLGATPVWTLLKDEHRPDGTRTVLQWTQHKHENPTGLWISKSWLSACSCDLCCSEATHFFQVISIVTWPLHRIEWVDYGPLERKTECVKWFYDV